MTARVPSLLSTASKARTTKIPVLQCLAQTSTSRQLSYLPNRRPANPAPLSTSHLCTRLASTSASPPPPAASAISSPQVPPQTTVSTHLTWNRFLQLRSIRRRYNLVSSILTAGATTFGGIVFLGQQDLDRLGNLLFGLDPIMAMGMGVVACGAAGWLIGPFAGNAAFGLWYRRLGPEIALKEKDFYQHIKRHRVDPSSQSVSNPVPDYYGEKIDSLKAYRQWLKDQRAFTRKRQSY